MDRGGPRSPHKAQLRLHEPLRSSRQPPQMPNTTRASPTLPTWRQDTETQGGPVMGPRSSQRGQQELACAWGPGMMSRPGGHTGCPLSWAGGALGHSGLFLRHPNSVSNKNPSSANTAPACWIKSDFSVFGQPASPSPREKSFPSYSWKFKCCSLWSWTAGRQFYIMLSLNHSVI